METFPWIPDESPKGKEKPRVLKSTFGDGYVQRTGDGTNRNLPTWPFTFSVRVKSEYDAILAFLRARDGQEAFLFTVPGESTARKFVCSEWDMTPYANGSSFRIDCTFEAQP